MSQAIRFFLITCMLLLFAAKGFTQRANLTNNGAQLARNAMVQAKVWHDKKDTAKAMFYLRRAKAAYMSDSLFKPAAEVALNMEEYYQYFGGTDMTVRIAYYEQALSLFKKTTAKARQEATLKTLGDFYQVQGNYRQALDYLLQAQKLENQVSEIDKESLYDLLGAVYVMLGDLNKGLTYGLLAVKITEQLKDSTMQACAVYNRVGMTYYQMKRLPEARHYYEKSLAFAVHLKSIETEISLYVNIAQVLINSGKYNECIAMLKQVIKKHPTEVEADHLGLDNSLLKCYIRLKQFKEAKFYVDRLEAESLKINPFDNDQQIIQTLLTAYYVATRQSQPAHQHLATLQKIGVAQQSPFVQAIAYQLAAKLDSTEHKFASAYKNYLLADKLKDSVWNERQNQQASRLHIQYETEKKDQDLKVKEDRIRLLRNQAQLQRINLKQEKNTQRLIIGSALLMVILLALSYRAYRLKTKANRQLQVQRLEIDQKNESLIRLIHQKDTLLTEKEWLMKEIHHRVKNNLQIVISLLSTQSKYLDNDIAYNAIRESQHRMQSISLIHQKLYQSENLALVDISAYIGELVTYLRESFHTDPRIAFEMDIAPIKLDVTRAVPLGLILNEAITNAIKYAFPDNRRGQISIYLKATDENAFILRIHDNGVGMQATLDLQKNRSLGMSLMRGLSKQLSGSLNIVNDNGITITIDFINEILLKAV